MGLKRLGIAATKQKIRDSEIDIIDKAISDKSFRKKLLKQPLETLSKELGEKLSNQLKIIVLEESLNSIHLILPRATENQDELSEDEMEMVCGGAGSDGHDDTEG